ncbi:MAG: IS21-like element helper ATPase IstB [Nitrospinaceae bacterium]|nr:IS21-like element helper ATPase IstB [Nitrospinaceae bacterium]
MTKLRLPGIRSSYKDWLDRATKEDLSYADFLEGLMQEELAKREESQLKRRTKQAALPFMRTIEQFDFTFRPELKRQVIGRYLDPGFIASATTLVFIGAPGLGKTHLAVAVSAKMLQLGATVRFVTAQSLAAGVLRCRDVEARQRLLKPLFNADLFVLDELGYIPTDPRLGPVLYELIATRYEKKPTIITTNKALSEWGGIFQDTSLAAALIDRLIHHGDIYHFEGPSFRLKGKTPDGMISLGTSISNIAGSDGTRPQGKEETRTAS